jgi:voltage-gated potassium channel Kch
MILRLLAASALLSFCVVVHAVGVIGAMRGWRLQTLERFSFWRATWLFVRLAVWIVLLHLVEIAAWAAFYWWRGAMPDAPSAIYFSAVTYTTTGYGDLVLPQAWRLVGAIEALTGILMCGWSTGFFFAVVGGMLTAENVRKD